jgi:hypothetical protein
VDANNYGLQPAGELPDCAGQHERRGGGTKPVSVVLQNAVLPDETMTKSQISLLREIETCQTVVPALLAATMRIPEVATPETAEYEILGKASDERKKFIENKYATRA